MAQHRINTQDELSTIQRCPHDGPNPYTQISNKLIRDNTISPQCIHMLIMLLSNDEYKWNIRVKQLVKYYEPHMGRNSVYRLIQEAIAAGYMKRVYIEVAGSNLRAGTIYYISESPKFKEENAIKENIELKLSFRHSNFRDTENQDIEIANSPRESDDSTYSSKKEHLLRNNPISPLPESTEFKECLPRTALPDLANSEQSASPLAASAAHMNPRSSKIDRIPKSAPEYSESVKQLVHDVTTILRADTPDIKLPADKALLQQAHLLLDTDKRSSCDVIAILKWTLSDSFWRAKIFKPNPIAYLRKMFQQLREEMNKKPKSYEIDRTPRDSDGNPITSYRGLF